MDINRIDSHKLILHPRRVADWLEGKQVYPINMEICLTGACNHRCVFCCLDYMGHKSDYLDNMVVSNLFTEMAPLGLKSVLFAGSGEPLLHPDFTAIVNQANLLGIDTAVSTNGVLFTPDKQETCLGSLSWVRFSISAGTEENYLRIQRGRKGDLQRVLDNIRYAAELKKRKGYGTVLNVQIVTIPENEDEIILLGKKVREAGAEAYIVKSYGSNAEQRNSLNEQMSKRKGCHSDQLTEELENLATDSFNIVYRANREQGQNEMRLYNECYAAPFHACIGANGEVWPCCNLQGLPEYEIGNIKETTFSEIWGGYKRARVMESIAHSDFAMCPNACKLDRMNRYLDELKHPGAHVNFI